MTDNLPERIEFDNLVLVFLVEKQSIVTRLHYKLARTRTSATTRTKKG
jgi:hypothetical protein